MLDDLIRPLQKSWLTAIKAAIEHKRKEFSDDAEEIMRFYEGPHDFMYTPKYASDHGYIQMPGEESGFPNPFFRMTYNKPAEVVQLFGPSLYHRNPKRFIEPREQKPIDWSILGDPNDPYVGFAIQQRMQNSANRRKMIETSATLFDEYLNYTPNELDLRGNSRFVIDEAILKGMGMWSIGTYRPRGANFRLVGSFHRSVDHYFYDPDMESRKHARVLFGRRTMPKHEAEEMFRLPKGSIEGNAESRTRAAVAASPDSEYWKARGDVHDLFTFYEVFSRMGMGNHLREFTHSRNSDFLAHHLDELGPYCYLAVSDDYDWPLNLPEHVCRTGTRDEIFERVQWPIPFWADPTDPWPNVDLAFHDTARKIYPYSHIKPALGELRFLNWAFSFLADKIKNTSRDFLAIAKHAGEDMKSQVLTGADLTVLEFEVSQNKGVNELVQFLQHPTMNQDLWRIIEANMVNLDKRLGTPEAMYGVTNTQDRSATSTQAKVQGANIRPDDMAEIVEDRLTLCARKEAFAAYWTLGYEDLVPILGPDRAQLWQQTISQLDPREVLLELNYRIEAGSVRKPNRDRDLDNANRAWATVGPIGQMAYQMTGDPSILNKLLEMWAKANDMEPIQIQPPPPQPNPEEQKLQLEQQKMQADMQFKQQQQKVAAELQVQESAAELQLEGAKAQQEMMLDAAEHAQEMQQDRQKHLLEMLQTRQESDLKLDVARTQAAQKVKEGEAKIELAKKQAAAKPKPLPKKKK